MALWYLTQYSPKCVITATKATTNTTTRVLVTKPVISTSHKIGGEVPNNKFLSNHTRKQTRQKESDEREGKRISEPSNLAQRTTIWFCIIFTYFIS